MSLMACNALDYLVAMAMRLEIDAREDGVYLKDGTRWQPTVNWSQIGPVINKLDLEFTHIVDRYQPVMAMNINSHGGVCGETHQVAVCNYVVMYSKILAQDTVVPYPKVDASTLRIRDEKFVKKYPMLNVDDIATLEEINRMGVAAFLKESAELHKETLKILPPFIAAKSRDHGADLVKTVINYYPELISVEAHAMGI